MLGVDVPSSALLALIDTSTEAKSAFLFFGRDWRVELGPQRSKGEVALPASRIARVKDIHYHARVSGYHGDAPLPDANLHVILMNADVAAQCWRPELSVFVARVQDLASNPSFCRIGPRIEQAFRIANGFDPPRFLGEMFTVLTAYICALDLHPDRKNEEAFREPYAFRSFLSLCHAGNILFRIENEVAHNLCLAT